MLQGDTLAPFLFIIAWDFTLGEPTGDHTHLGFAIMPTQSHRAETNRIIDFYPFHFADNIALLSNQRAQGQDLLTRLEIECQKVGLYLKKEILLQSRVY